MMALAYSSKCLQKVMPAIMQMKRLFRRICQRPTSDEEAEEIQIIFSNKVPTTFYSQVQDAIEKNDMEPFFDFAIK